MPDALSFGSFEILRDQQLLLNAGAHVKLGSRAFDVLIALTDRAGEVVTSDELPARARAETG
jgi:DNA-binding winged helix-turn-helix (wHTH) protein